MKVSFITCRCFRKRATALAALLEGVDVELFLNGRWRTFTVKVEDGPRVETRNFGKRLPSPFELAQFLSGE
jgi:hypothetical protein